MKKVIFTVVLISFLSGNAYAMLTVDGFLTYLDAGDAEKQYGFGFGAGIVLTENINFLYRGAFTEGTSGEKTSSNTDKYGDYEHMYHAFGIEYTYTFPQIHLGWQTSLLAGMSSTVMDYTDELTPANDYHLDDDGFSFMLSTGIRYDINQYVSPFIEVGYHYCIFQNQLEDEEIRGLTALIGIRFRVWGKNKPIDHGY